MRKYIQKAILTSSTLGLILIGVFGYVFMAANPVYAAPCSTGGGALPTTVFVPWYKYLECGANGAPVIDGDPDSPAFNGGWGKAMPLIGMAVIEMLTRIAGLIAVGFIIWGGIQYTTSQGEPEGINNAKSTILNAIVGLVISLIAIGLVQFVAGLIR